MRNKSRIKIKNVRADFIETELLKFREANVNFKYVGNNEIQVMPSLQLTGVPKVHNMPYPGFAADLIAPFAVLMTQAKGTSLIHDWMFEGRLRYINELNKMGANAVICDPHRVVISGPTPLRGEEITSYDLRAGATLIIAALIAKGESKIHEIFQVDRGYECIEERLQKLGADIRRVKI